MEEKKDIAVIDLFKLFCAFLVVGIHTEPFASVGLLDMAFGILTRIAVPFFFIASAYFYFLKPTSKERCAKFCLRILILYSIWSVVYFFAACIEEKRFDALSALSFAKEFFLSGYEHLWFLQALIISIASVTALDSVLRGKTVMYIAASVLLAAGLLLSTYVNLFGPTSLISSMADSGFIRGVGVRSWLFYGIPYVTMGYYFAKRAGGCGPQRNICLFDALGAAVSFCLLAAEGFAAVKVIGTTVRSSGSASSR